MASLLGLCLFSTSCAVQTSAKRDDLHVMEVSVPQQKMALYRQGKLIKTYPISTSKFGLGDEKGSYRTPLGKMEVAEKIGQGKPAGAVFKSRKWTGEVIKPNSPGRDPIVSRILWLNGLEPKNKNTYSRCIYIHGTAAENSVGKASSYGCVRMKSRDVIDLHSKVGVGSKVFVVRKGLWRDEAKAEAARKATIQALPPVDPPATLPVMESQATLATLPVLNPVDHSSTGVDVLSGQGWDRGYIETAAPVVNP
ncbi:MAG: L,D-transpeptidase [Verrucomicrobiales bacterium]|nr:L,D-transpeptidase [Verrucomicrobiales bacterium]